MSKRICFVTGTRADYGIMAPIMRAIATYPETDLQIIATNMHLSHAYGFTINEIEADGFNVDIKIDSLESGGTSEAVVKSMAKVEAGMSDAFEKLKPDLIVILGDRYEALAAAAAAVAFNIPVAHLHGGETTEGAIDEKFRHAITQLADYHFAATPQYVDKIISMGKRQERVFHSGAPGAEIIEEPESPQTGMDFYEKTGLRPEEPFLLLAMHPVTTLPDKGEKEVKATLAALDTFINQGYKVLLTMPNSDPGSRIIASLLEKWSALHKDSVVAVKSLGAGLFRYAMDHAAAMVGNSSAALIEAPSYRLPAVNVGIRQKGRAYGPSVLNVPGETSRILQALQAALSLEMKAVVMGLHISALNPYYKENSTSFIAQTLRNLSGSGSGE